MTMTQVARWADIPGPAPLDPERILESPAETARALMGAPVVPAPVVPAPVVPAPVVPAAVEAFVRAVAAAARRRLPGLNIDPASGECTVAAALLRRMEWAEATDEDVRWVLADAVEAAVPALRSAAASASATSRQEG